MPLQKQVLDITLAGIDESIDDKLLPNGRLIEATNVEFDSKGALNKRKGYDALGTSVVGGGSIGTPRMLTSHDSELVLADGAKLYGYSEAIGQWVDRGEYRPCKHTLRTYEGDIASTGTTWYDYSSTTAAAVLTHRDSTNAYATIIDRGTWQTIGDPIDFGAASYAPTASTLSDHFVGAGTGIYTASTLAPQTWSLLDSVPSGDIIGMVYYGDEKIAVAWYTATELRLQLCTSSGLIGSPLAYTLPTGPGFYKPAMASGSGTDLAIVFHDGAITRDLIGWWVGGTTTLSQFFAPVTIDTTVATQMAVGYVGSDMFTWYTKTSGGSIAKYATLNASGTLTGPTNADAGYLPPVAQLFQHDSTPMLPVYLPGVAGVAVINPQTYVPYARWLPGETTTSLGMSSVYNPSSGIYEFAVNKYLTTGDSSRTAPTVVTLDFNHVPSVAKGADSLILSGSVVMEYDGGQVYENNFIQTPARRTSTGTSASGGSLSDGTYSFVIVWRWWDDHGRIHYSTPSTPYSVTLSGGGASQKFTVYTGAVENSSAADPVTYRSNVEAVVYVTEASGSIYYYGGSSFLDTSTAVEVTDVDTSGAQVYTQDGTLEFSAPPQLVSLVDKGRRVYGVTSDGTMWFTHQHISGYNTAFSAFLTKSLGQRLEDSQLGVIDDSIIAVGSEDIRVVTGDGPSLTGAQDDLSEPRAIQADTGRTSDSYALSTHMGIIFKTSRGLTLLDRALQLQPAFGEPAEDCTSLTMTSAAAVPAESQFVFGASNGDAYVYDYTSGQWATFDGRQMTTACMHDGVLHWGVSGDEVRKTSTDWQDGVSNFSMSVKTPWVKVGSPQAYGRIYNILILGEWRSSNTLTMKLYYDYNGSTAAETIAFDLTSGYNAGDVLQLRHYAGRKCQSVLVELSDSGTGESAKLSAITLEIAQKAGPYRPSTTVTG